MLWDVWSPFDVVRMVWDFFMLAMLLYVIFVTPYLVAFDIGTYDLTQPIAAFDLAVNCIFMTDVLLNFRTAFQGVEVCACLGRDMPSRAACWAIGSCGGPPRWIHRAALPAACTSAPATQTAMGAWCLTASSSPSTT